MSTKNIDKTFLQNGEWCDWEEELKAIEEKEKKSKKD